MYVSRSVYFDSIILYMFLGVVCLRLEGLYCIEGVSYVPSSFEEKRS